MKEMPERIYLFDCNDAMTTPLEGDTEYIKKDSFIEKACKYISWHQCKYIDFEDFKNYMDGKDDGTQTKFMGSYTTTTETDNGKKYKDYRKDK